MSQSLDLTGHDPWQLYDRLIAAIPAGIKVLGWSLGRRWSYVDSEAGCGIAMTVGGGLSMGKGADFLGGDAAMANELELHQMAAYLKSWRFTEASVGMAAVNAWHNNPANNPALATLAASPPSGGQLPHGGRQGDIIEAEIGAQPPGAKVTVIGHFPRLERYAELVQLTILERNPSEDDLPDSACEYILPAQDLVVVTGTAATNKTLPRLLALSAQARTVIAGPSACCAALLKEFGVDVVGGAVVVDAEAARTVIAHGAQLPFGHGVDMVRLVL